jgi:paraquat-inducible protein B
MKFKPKLGWLIWLFPISAALFSGWLLANNYRQKEAHIRVTFDSAAGIQIEKTQIRFRGVPIGIVNDLFLSKDLRDVVADIILTKYFSEFAVDGSRFSLVIPNVSLQGVTGLDTILDGTYINVVPGVPGIAKTNFKAGASNSLGETLDDTSSYLLETANAESIAAHDSVTFRGFKVGSVTKLTLSRDGRTVHIQINIENRNAKLIHANSVFWRKAGIQAKFGLFHSEIKVNSMDSIINGGVEFATPDASGPVAKSDQIFLLNSSAPKDVEKWNPKLD